jgi:hypothetical protein
MEKTRDLLDIDKKDVKFVLDTLKPFWHQHYTV